LREEKLVPIGKAEKYVFDILRFSRGGSRRKQAATGGAELESAGAEKNYNSGGVVAKETGKDAKMAHIKLLHDAEHPSGLELPVVK